MTVTLCVEDELCFWGPGDEYDCYGYNVDPNHCVDSDNGATDAAGDGCEWYEVNTFWCGWWDDNDFAANEMCCACQEQWAEWMDWFDDWWGHDPSYPDGCVNTPNGATDSWGDSCLWYDWFPHTCGDYDDDDFTADEMCCICIGQVEESTEEPDWTGQCSCMANYDYEGEEAHELGRCESIEDIDTCVMDAMCQFGPMEEELCGYTSLIGDYINTLYVGEDAHYGDFVNDWHFVTISEGDSDNELIWTNLAGHSWVLYYETGKLRTGNDCPYSDLRISTQELHLHDDGTLTYMEEPYARVKDLDDWLEYAPCVDTDNGAKDVYGDGCSWYDAFPADCGLYDDDNFFSNEMCCSCIERLEELGSEESEDTEEESAPEEEEAEVEEEESVPEGEEEEPVIEEEEPVIEEEEPIPEEEEEEEGA